MVPTAREPTGTAVRELSVRDGRARHRTAEVGATTALTPAVEELFPLQRSPAHRCAQAGVVA